MNFLCNLLTTSLALSLGTTKLRATSDAPSEIISMFASASAASWNTLAEAPVRLIRSSPTAQTSGRFASFQSDLWLSVPEVLLDGIPVPVPISDEPPVLQGASDEPREHPVLR